MSGRRPASSLELVKNDITSTAKTVRNGVQPMEDAAHGLPKSPPNLGALTPAFAELSSEFAAACANMIEVTRRAADDLDKCAETYSENEHGTAAIFDNIKRDH